MNIRDGPSSAGVDVIFFLSPPPQTGETLGSEDQRGLGDTPRATHQTRTFGPITSPRGLADGDGERTRHIPDS